MWSGESARVLRGGGGDRTALGPAAAACSSAGRSTPSRQVHRSQYFGTGSALIYSSSSRIRVRFGSAHCALNFTRLDFFTLILISIFFRLLLHLVNVDPDPVHRAKLMGIHEGPEHFVNLLRHLQATSNKLYGTGTHLLEITS
jgi:hypothetical protein